MRSRGVDFHFSLDLASVVTVLKQLQKPRLLRVESLPDLRQSQGGIVVLQSTVPIRFADFANFDTIRNAAPVIRRRLLTVTTFFAMPIPSFLIRDGNHVFFSLAASRIIVDRPLENAEQDVLHEILVVRMIAAAIFRDDLPHDIENFFDG